jgi:peptidoglycan/xylan/chitin deacetylase (PgdA/CDA1 family)
MKKKIIANLLFYTGVSYLLFRIRLLSTGIRVINYHCTPESSVPQFKKQLKFYKKYFEDVNLIKLSNFYKKADNIHRKSPGLIISFDDGLRSNFDNAIGIIEDFGFTGWFFIPAGFLLDSSKNFTIKNSIETKQVYPDNRYGISLDEAKHISENHIVGSHTFTHHRMSVHDTQTTLDHEIRQSKHTLEELLEIKEISCFCWVGGELNTYTSQAYKEIKDAGYKYIFATNTQPITRGSSPFMICRSNIEAEDSIQIVLFQLSGIMDLLYFKRRSKLKKIFHLDIG